MGTLQYQIYENGSFALRSGGVRLLDCYPSLDGRPLRSTGISITDNSITYRLPGAELRLSFGTDEIGRTVLDCSACGLAGIHDIEPLGYAEIDAATGIYVQGFGMEGPSGCFRPPEDIPPSYGLTALYRDTGALMAYAEDHRKYTCVFRILRFPALAGARQTISGGFNLEGTAGRETVLPALYFEDAPNLSEGLRICAERIAAHMGARKRMPPAFFWSSWYHAYETMDQARLEKMLDGIRRENVPFQYIELDAGYTPHLGDWLTPNHRWPGGIQQAAETILSAGFQAGIWVGPFIVGDGSALYREHPDWVLRDPEGKPVVQIRSYTEPKMWGNPDCEYYILDASNPGAMAYIKTVFETLRSWGFSFFKTDFMLWNMRDSSTVRRYNPKLTSVEILRNVLKTIRGAIGEESYLLGCIAPFMPFIGYADGMRLAGDCGAQWAETFGPLNLLRELPSDNYFNHVFWQNDPDAMLLRDFHTMLTPDEVQSLALLQAVSGGAVSTSDPVGEMSEARKRLLKFVEPRGAVTPELPYLGGDRRELVMLHRLKQGNLLFVLNPTDTPLTVVLRLSELFGRTEWYQSRLDWQAEKLCSVKDGVFCETLAPHTSALVFVTEQPLRSRPENLWDW